MIGLIMCGAMHVYLTDVHTELFPRECCSFMYSLITQLSRQCSRYRHGCPGEHRIRLEDVSITVIGDGQTNITALLVFVAQKKAH